MIKTFLIFLFSSFLLFAQTGNIRGRITDKDGPMLSVNVFLLRTNTGTVSDKNGKYELKNIQAGKYTIRFSAVGYETQNLSVEVFPNKIVELNVEMKVQVIEVDEVEVIDKYVRDKSDTRTSVIEINPENAKVLPGAVEDVFRTLQTLPGVLAPNDFSSQLVVRGSGPDQNLIVIDGVEIFNPYRLYGAVSMFNPDVVTDVNLVTGGFPAKYGDRLSAVLDVSNREGDLSSSFKGSVNASILSANFVLEGKNPFNINGSWLFNSRRTYYDLIIEPFVKNTGLVKDNVSFPNFYDLQGKIVFGPFKGHKFSLIGIHSQDGVDVVSGKNRKTPDSIAVDNITLNNMTAFTWQYASSRNLINKVQFSYYLNGGNTDFDSQILDPSLNRKKYEDVLPDTISQYLLGFGLKQVFNFRKLSLEDNIIFLWGNNSFEAGAGIDVIRSKIDFDFTLDPRLLAIFTSNPNFRTVFDDISDIKDFNRIRFYIQNKFAIGERFFIQPGFRVDNYFIIDKSYFSPRISISYALDEITTLRTSWGIFYQSPGYEKLRDRGILFNFSKENTTPLEAEKAIHYVIGIERWVDNEWNLKLETYYKDFRDLIYPKYVDGSKFYTELIPGRDPKFLSSWTRPVAVPNDSLTQIPVNSSYGEAYGLEILLAKINKTFGSKITGWVSYSLAYANRFERGIKTPFIFDQRHTFNLVLNYQLNDIWDLGLRWQYGSGFPYTSPDGIKPRIILTDTNGDLIPETPTIDYRTTKEGKEVVFDMSYSEKGRFNSRKPAYHRLDIRINAAVKIWSLDWSFYLDVINVYNRSNVINYNYFVEDDLKVGREPTNQLPILPTLGFSIKF